jgi:hypothetical protein
MRVLGRQLGSCCFVYELKGASAAYGRSISSPELPVSGILDCGV